MINLIIEFLTIKIKNRCTRIFILKTLTDLLIISKINVIKYDTRTL